MSGEIGAWSVLEYWNMEEHIDMDIGLSDVEVGAVYSISPFERSSTSD